MTQVPVQQTDWKQNWQQDHIGFHLSHTNTKLSDHADVISDCKRVLVPLCGKTLDLHYLASLGHVCVGIELVYKAIADFFSEWGVTPLENAERNSYSHDKIEILNQNVFAVTPEQTGLFDAIYDRAALVALPVPIRQRYVDHLFGFLPKGGKILLNSYDMPRSQQKGPPFAVRNEDVPVLYRRAASIDLLSEETTTADQEPRLKDRNLEWGKRTLWLITK